MHITIFVYGTWGDLRPHVRLGQALQMLGHELQVVASRVYEDWVRARGLDFYPLSTDVNVFTKENAAILDQNVIQQLRIARNEMTPIFTRMGLETLDATRQSNAVITVEFGVALLFDILKSNHLKTILINPAPLTPTREFASAAVPRVPDWFPFPEWYNHISYTFVQRTQWQVLGSARNKIATEHLHVPKSKFQDFQAMLAATPTLTTVSPQLISRPSDWDDIFQITGYLFDDDPDWTPPHDLLAFLDAGDPPVYIGFGSMPDSKPAQTTKIIIDAVQRSGKRAIVLKGWAGLGADAVPETIHILDYAPHHWLFPQMAAVVHHGGAGTTAAGFRAGVPTVIIPHSADQPYWGALVDQLGLGAAPIPRKKLTVENMTQAIQVVTSDDEIRANARALGEKIRQEDGLAEAVHVVQTWLKA